MLRQLPWHTLVSLRKTVPMTTAPSTAVTSSSSAACMGPDERHRKISKSTRPAVRVHIARHPPACTLAHPRKSVCATAVGPKVSNTRGTAAIAHWDVPDCGNSEFFINLGTNAHLDEAYGGYCVFAQVEDDASFAIVDAIAAAVKSKSKVAVTRITCP